MKLARPVGVAALVLAASGCSEDLLNVPTPNVITSDALGGSLGATTLRNGALRDFVNAYSGSIDGYVVVSGNLGDEIQTTDTFADRIDTDGRNASELLGGSLNTTFNSMQRARTSATNAIVAWNAAKSGTVAAVRDSLSEIYSHRGLIELMFGEGYCAGVPFSKVLPNGDFEYGDPLTNAQMFTTALATADSALAIGQGATARNLAALVRGRVLLDQGNFAQAATAVSTVPTSFVYRAFHNAVGAQQNGIHNAVYVNGSRYMVTTQEGTNGLDYLTTPADPRVPWTRIPNRIAFDNNVAPNRGDKYPALASSAVIADGIEARLIEAEARLNATSGGSQADRDAMFAQLNTLRATGLATAITPLAASPTTQAAAVNMLFRERGMWLWLTGHRLGDMRRLARQYGRAVNTVFPVGPLTFRGGQTYGNLVTLIVPFAERNNPKFTGCLNNNP
jgi:hypothetical protein